MRGSLRDIFLRGGECLSYAGGIALTGFFLSQLALGEVQRRENIASFESLRDAPAAIAVDHLPPPDMTLWSPGRVADYQASLRAELPPVLGVLSAPSLGLEVPVYATDSELTMDRGAGIIDGMAYPHEGGNIGIAGHRDGYFRVLKDISVGDSLTLQTLSGPKRFTVERTRVVEIEDTHVLADTDHQSLTLVTCYPFYFVGHAPQRFVVTATLDKNYVNRN